jgi:hypothetical protein
MPRKAAAAYFEALFLDVTVGLEKITVNFSYDITITILDVIYFIQNLTHHYTLVPTSQETHYVSATIQTE